MTIHIVLVHPKMPANTGNIIRLCANTGAVLHLIEPLGFDLEDKKLRRAGLDYHEFAHLQVHSHWQAARVALESAHCTKIVALTTKLSRPFYDYDFLSNDLPSTSVLSNTLIGNSVTGNSLELNEVDKGNVDNKKVATDTIDPTAAKASDAPDNIALVFGSETAGLPEDIRADIGADNWLRLPMLPDSRSLNLSNSVAICLYEVWRQQGFIGDAGQSTGYDTLAPYDAK